MTQLSKPNDSAQDHKTFLPKVPVKLWLVLTQKKINVIHKRCLYLTVRNLTDGCTQRSKNILTSLKNVTDRFRSMENLLHWMTQRVEAIEECKTSMRVNCHLTKSLYFTLLTIFIIPYNHNSFCRPMLYHIWFNTWHQGPILVSMKDKENEFEERTSFSKDSTTLGWKEYTSNAKRSQWTHQRRFIKYTT